MTSKLQVTIPKAVAERFKIKPGDELEWIPAGDSIRVMPPGKKQVADVAERLELFDLATERQLKRQAGRSTRAAPADRGWRREDIYIRGGAD